MQAGGSHHSVQAECAIRSSEGAIRGVLVLVAIAGKDMKSTTDSHLGQESNVCRVSLRRRDSKRKVEMKVGGRRAIRSEQRRLLAGTFHCSGLNDKEQNDQRNTEGRRAQEKRRTRCGMLNGERLSTLMQEFGFGETNFRAA